jgi:SET domain-containing protein
MRQASERSRTARAPKQNKAPNKAKKAAEGIAVRRSTIQGRGVFATRDFKRGDRIVEYVGERISHEEASRRYDDEAVDRHHTFLFTVDDEVCVDGASAGNEARYINHSCAPNAYAQIDRKRIFIYAKRTIRAGDEILYDYAYTVDPTYTLDDLRRIYPCGCGAATCRGTLAGVKVPRAKKAKKADDSAVSVADSVSDDAADAQDATTFAG